MSYFTADLLKDLLNDRYALDITEKEILERQKYFRE